MFLLPDVLHSFNGGMKGVGVKGPMEMGKEDAEEKKEGAPFPELALSPFLPHLGLRLKSG